MANRNDELKQTLEALVDRLGRQHIPEMREILAEIQRRVCASIRFPVGDTGPRRPVGRQPEKTVNTVKIARYLREHPSFSVADTARKIWPEKSTSTIKRRVKQFNEARESGSLIMFGIPPELLK